MRKLMCINRRNPANEECISPGFPSKQKYLGIKKKNQANVTDVKRNKETKKNISTIKRTEPPKLI